MLESVHPGWMPLFYAEHDRLVEILAKLSSEEVVPARANIFRAFEQDPRSIRVLILGQDPYPNPDHAMGLAFCVPSGTYPLPPSLENIFKELRSDLGYGMVRNKDISSWSQHGVMLLNRHLTTRPGETAAHLGLGWDLFTEAAVRFLQELKGSALVAILWGSKAQQLSGILQQATVISSPHPSPLSSYRGFFGSKPFSGCNKALLELGLEPIDWSC
ncbi:MAG: uracil-DNA glycosylase [Aquiluna sp.]